MVNYKVGDRVIAKKVHDGSIPTGIGIIKRINRESRAEIEFLGWDGRNIAGGIVGHDGSGLCKNPHGWNYPREKFLDGTLVLLKNDFKELNLNGIEIIFNKKELTISNDCGVIKLNMDDFKKIYKKVK